MNPAAAPGRFALAADLLGMTLATVGLVFMAFGVALLLVEG